MRRRLALTLLTLPIGLYAYACSGSSDSGNGSDAGTGEDSSTEGTDSGGNNGTDSGGNGTDSGQITDSGNPTDASDGSVVFPFPIPDGGAVVRPVYVPAAGTNEFMIGPQWFDGGLFFSDFDINGLYRLVPDAGVAPATIRLGGRPTGNAVDKDGLLTGQEDTGFGNVVREVADGSVFAVSGGFGGARYDMPKDLEVRRGDGTIYVTDPDYFGDPQAGGTGIYLIKPGADGGDGGTLQEKVFSTKDKVNGIAFSADEKVLYVSVTDLVDSQIRAYPVATDGTLGAESIFAHVGPNAEGMASDQAGNVYVGTLQGIEVYAPEKADAGDTGTGGNGAYLGRIKLPKKPVGLAFGGADLKTLFATTVDMDDAGGFPENATSTPVIYAINLLVPGRL